MSESPKKSPTASGSKNNTRDSPPQSIKEDRMMKQESSQKQKGQQRQLPEAQQQPVNFGTDDSSSNPTGGNSYAGSRRVTLGGKSSNHHSHPNSKSDSDDDFGKLTKRGPSNSSLGLGGGFGSMSDMGGMMGRRGSMNSVGMDDFLSGLQSRRGSMAGFDALGGVDSLFGAGGSGMGRRDSIDSTTATLDAAFMDLNRRRYSMGLPPLPQEGGGLSSLEGGGRGDGRFSDSRLGDRLGDGRLSDRLGDGRLSDRLGDGRLSDRLGDGRLSDRLGDGRLSDRLGDSRLSDRLGDSRLSEGRLGSQEDSLGMGSSSQRQGSSLGGAPQESLAARQAQLQAQQHELELQQKKLEMERQKLLEGIRSRNFGPGGGGGMGMGFGGPMPNERFALMERMGVAQGMGYERRRPSFPYGSNPSELLGAGMGTSSHSHHTSVSLDQSARSYGHRSAYPQQGLDHSMGREASLRGNPGGMRGEKWHVCSYCDSKAFASVEEALAHETLCLENPNRSRASGNYGGGGYFGGAGMYDRAGPDNMMMEHSGSMGRRFSMGMDNSQRSYMSLGGLGDSIRGMGPLSRMSIGMGSMAGLDVSQRSGLSMSTNNLDASARSHPSMDGSNHSYIEGALSNGPFTMLQHPMPLAMESDKDWLTPLHCFVRRHCVEVFTATEDDVATPSKGKRKPIQVGQIGIRCPHCHRYTSSNNSTSSKARERGSVYYPTSIKSIYNATMNLLQRHLHSCPAVPEEIMRRYETLKADDARSGTSKRYWEESALSLGLVDTHNGIRFSALRPPPLPSLTSQQESTGQSSGRRNSNEFFSTKSNAVTDVRNDGPGDAATARKKNPSEEESKFLCQENAVSQTETSMTDSAPLVTTEDKPYSTNFSYHLLSQMQPCVFTEADRLGKRKGLPPGFPGLACRHCFGGYGSGRFFPSSIKTLSDTSKTLNVLHNHMMRCRKCPAEIRENLDKLRGSHDEERAKMKFGSQKAFFARIWERLHGKNFPVALKRARPQQQRGNMASASGQARQQANQHMMQQMMGQQGYNEMQRPPQTMGGSNMDSMSPSGGSPSKRQKTH